MDAMDLEFQRGCIYGLAESFQACCFVQYCNRGIQALNVN